MCWWKRVNSNLSRAWVSQWQLVSVGTFSYRGSPRIRVGGWCLFPNTKPEVASKSVNLKSFVEVFLVSTVQRNILKFQGFLPKANLFGRNHQSTFRQNTTGAFGNTKTCLEALNQGKVVGIPKMDPTIWILQVVALISIIFTGLQLYLQFWSGIDFNANN